VPLLVGGIESVAMSEMPRQVSDDWPTGRQSMCLSALPYLTMKMCDGSRPMVGLQNLSGVAGNIFCCLLELLCNVKIVTGKRMS
jgi:hypothetical protein